MLPQLNEAVTLERPAPNTGRVVPMSSKFSISQSDVERFRSSVDRNGPVPVHATHLGRCWLWTRSTVTRGYGKIGINKRRYMTHRLAWEIEHGPIPKGLWVLHKCDEKRCCNPAHLYLGTHKDNTRDAVARGRMRSGEQHGRVKLTDAEVIEVLHLCNSGMYEYAEIAEQYSISREYVYDLSAGRFRKQAHRLADSIDHGS